MRVFIHLILVCLLLCCRIAAAYPMLPLFQLNQQPVNPVCVWLLVKQYGWAGNNSHGQSMALPDFHYDAHNNIIAAINVPVCQASHTAGQVTIQPQKDQHPWIRYQFPWGVKSTQQDLPRGSFSYQYVGISSSGLIVLHVVSNSGGSGQFDGIVLLQAKKTQRSLGLDAAWIGSSKVRLSLLAYLPGGDRASGGLTHITLHGNQLKFQQQSHKNPPMKSLYPAIDRQYTLT